MPCGDTLYNQMLVLATPRKILRVQAATEIMSYINYLMGEIPADSREKDSEIYVNGFLYDQYLAYEQKKDTLPVAFIGAMAAALPALFVWNRLGGLFAVAAMAAMWMGYALFRGHAIKSAALDVKELTKQGGRSLICVQTEADKQRYKEIQLFLEESAVKNGTAPPPKLEKDSKPVEGCVMLVVAAQLIWWTVRDWRWGGAMAFLFDYSKLMACFAWIGASMFRFKGRTIISFV